MQRGCMYTSHICMVTHISLVFYVFYTDIYTCVVGMIEILNELNLFVDCNGVIHSYAYHIFLSHIHTLPNLQNIQHK